MHAFAARYQDQCAADCGQSIRPGDMIRYDDDDEIVHVGCYNRPRKPICPKCHMEGPCDCE